MLKHLLNHASPTSLMLFDIASDEAASKAKAELRENLAKGNTVKEETVVEKEGEEEEVEGEEGEEEEGEEEGEEEPELDADGNPIEKVEETAEEKTAREAKERAEFKAKRKDERVQKRIDKAVAAQGLAEAELARVKLLLDAKPADEKLTEAEVQARAEAIANEKITTAEVTRLQLEFNKNCDKIQDAAEKLDTEFTKKVNELAAEIGPLPTRMMNVLFELENGPAVLAYLVNDVDEAERIYDLNNKPERLGIALARLADKLAEEAKPKPKQISKVPDGVKPVNGNRVQSSVITAKDTTPEGMDNYVRKRRLQMEQRKREGR